MLNCSNSIDASGNGYIDFQRDALAALEAQQIRLIHIDSSNQKDISAPYWAMWTHGTNGAYVPINPDGNVPQGLNLADLIVGAIRQVAGASAFAQLNPDLLVACNPKITPVAALCP